MSLSCEPIEGELLRLSRWHTASAVLLFLTAVLVGSGAVRLIILVVRLPLADFWFTAAFRVMGLLVAVYFINSGFNLLTHRPCLVLGRDRLQFRLGKHVSWEVQYGDIADIALFTPVHAFGYRMVWTSSLGIRLSDPGAFDAAYPQLARSRSRRRRRCGFDLGIPLMGSVEPPQRCLEAVLRCYHLFKADQQELR
jgi:hypothetical protein